MANKNDNNGNTNTMTDENDKTNNTGNKKSFIPKFKTM